MQHWVQRLSTTKSTRAVSSTATRQRALATIGPDAVNWGIDAGARMARSIVERLDEWSGDRSAPEIESLARATEASSLDTLCALVNGDTDQLGRSREPRENVTYYVMRGIPLDEVVRNVHLGQDFIAQELLEGIAEVVDEATRMDAIREMNRVVSTGWARLISQVSAEYARELERWTRSTEGTRAQAIRRLLAGDDIDDLAAERLGYDLDQRHVAVVVWLDTVDAEVARLFNYEVFARELAAAAGSRTPPLVHFAASTYAEFWIGSPSQPVCDAFRDGTWPEQLRVTHGRPSDGWTGFRESVFEARAAHALARRASTLGACVSYDDVELVSLLVADPDRAATFVRRTLGPLAVDDERSRELRDTLAIWMDEQGSLSAASKALFMHRNSVAYRVRQAQELLGDNAERLRVRCAIAIAQLLPGDVLVPSSKGSDTRPITRPNPTEGAATRE